MTDPDRPWDAPKAAGADEAKTKRPIGCIVTVVAVLALFGGCGALLASGSGGGSSTTSDSEARRQCEEWVKERLKSPGTADFSGQSINGADPSWSIAGDVDSENTFGGVVRSAWTCDIRINGDQWTGNVKVS